ncbi:Sulfur relay protein, TusE/DsrC/DsvC family [Syntrophobacter sp. SbD1]|nr:Sulfur relay protein, TusE/DsrC/DsvC family [Syntrophobacter sp. SbD1]
MPDVVKGPERVHNLTTRVIEGKEVAFDEEGFFLNPESWSRAIAETIALEMGIAELTERQWEMIYFLRGFYLANGRAPLNRDIKKQTGVSLLELEHLFPGGIRGGARRLAGLPNPKSC